MSTEIRDTVNQNMKSAISLLYPIALLNTPEHMQIFFDPENGAAITGFRRQVANHGALLLRAQYGRNVRVEVAKNDDRTMCGTYNYARKDQPFVETNEGLLGTDIKEGLREAVNNEKAIEKIERFKEMTAMQYEVHLCPNVLHEHMESRARDYGNNTAHKKFNLFFTSGLPVGKFVGTGAFVDNRPVIVAKTRTKSGPKEFVCLIDKSSVIQEKYIQRDRVYLFEPVSLDKKTGQRTVNVIVAYKTGVRVAIQSFQNGLKKPNTFTYSVNPSGNNGVTERMVKAIPFMPSQNETMINGAPMLTFDLDMFKALMETLSPYPMVTLRFKDASSGCYFYAEGNEYYPQMEAIMGPTVQFVNGRVCLP